MSDILFFWAQFIEFFDTPLGIFSFITLYAIWVVILLPGSFLSMLGGAIYGTFWGSIFVFLAAFLGAEITFLLGRKFFQSFIQARIAKFSKFQTIQKAVSKEGFKLIFLTRLSPAFPFSLLNLIYSLSEVNIRDFSFGLIGILPGTILFCGLGSLAGDIAQFNSVLNDKKDINSLLFSAFGLLATCAVVFIVSRASRNALQEFDS